MSNLKKVVIAGNYGEYLDWLYATDVDPNVCEYIFERYYLIKWRGIDVIWTGSWRHRWDSGFIIKVANEANREVPK